MNVGITSTLYALCQLAANEVGESLHDYVAIAVQQRIHKQALEQRHALYVEACDRATLHSRQRGRASRYNAVSHQGQRRSGPNHDRQ